MTVGVIILAHERLDRVAQVAQFWASDGCPVAIHVDAKTPNQDVAQCQEQLSKFPLVSFCERSRCKWGSWSLVKATLAAASDLLARHPEVTHVLLSSGACLPLKPARAMSAYLNLNKDTDFIESVVAEKSRWIEGGLDSERFSYLHPFNWQTNRVLFEASVFLQRSFAVSRKLPDDLVPHIGSQWWCLTAKTLTAILNDPKRRKIDLYFRYSWIPDEGYFQTLARRHGRKIESRSLTFSRFDENGRPYKFYDDHAGDLAGTGAFVARKVWPGAANLYRRFLSTAQFPTPFAADDAFDRYLTDVRNRRNNGRAGLVSAARHPNPGWENGLTVAPFVMFEGLDALFEDFSGWLRGHGNVAAHGALFDKRRAVFADRAEFGPGGSSADPTLRDYDAPAFLRNLIWASGEKRMCFDWRPGHQATAMDAIVTDPNARIVCVSGAWIVPMFRSGASPRSVFAHASALQNQELEHLERLQAADVRARIDLMQLGDFSEAPERMVQAALAAIGRDRTVAVAAAPTQVSLQGLAEYLEELRNLGMTLRVFGPLDRLRKPTDVPVPARFGQFSG